MSEDTPASRRASRMLDELLQGDNDYRTGVVVLSYRRPGAGEKDVSFGYASGMRAADGALDFAMLADMLRKIAAQLDGYIQDPESLLRASQKARRR